MKDTGKTIVQCIQCGKIFKIDREISIENIYTKAYCSCCEHTETVLNLGDDDLDRYKYYDPVMDSRYYTY